VFHRCLAAMKRRMIRIIRRLEWFTISSLFHVLSNIREIRVIRGGAIQYWHFTLFSEYFPVVLE
jgi:hypothetical protein